MLHIIETIKEKQEDKIPDVLFALGLGFPLTNKENETVNYVINTIELKNYYSSDDNLNEE